MPWFHGKITREEAESLLTPREVISVCLLNNHKSNYLLLIGWTVFDS